MSEIEKLQLEIKMCRVGIAAAEAVLTKGMHTPTGELARPFINEALRHLHHTDPTKSVIAQRALAEED